ncbi:MAG TPA: OmpA family protein [Burkholderiaceae bacterium]|nr:OmpA family protein [Burkholderiaceae bacterium]
MQRFLIVAAGFAALALIAWFCAYPKAMRLASPTAVSPRAVASDAESSHPGAGSAPGTSAVPAPASPPPPPDPVAAAARVVAAVNGIIAGRVVEFEIGSATLAPGGRALLDKLVAPIQAEPDARLAIDGYTDNMGDPAFNVTLSRQRAEAVRAYLVDRGVAAARMEARGFGAERPVADNATADGRTRNRRVEFTVLK